MTHTVSMIYRSTWKQIIRKDGRDLWKSCVNESEHDGMRKRKHKEREIGLLGDCPSDEPLSKIRRNSGQSANSLSNLSVKSENSERISLQNSTFNTVNIGNPIATSSVVPYTVL